MWIPENLLTEGILSVSIALFKPNPLDILIYLDKVIYLNIYDGINGNSARGYYTLGFPGYIRPLLKWENEQL